MDQFGKPQILPFPKRILGRRTVASATWWHIIGGRFRIKLGWFLNVIGVPGPIKATRISDPVTGQELTVAISSMFVRLNINGRDYYFSRISGKFSGTGTGCC